MYKNLKITSIEIYKCNIKLREPFRIAIAEIKNANSIFVKISTNENVYGFGEANPIWRITGETQGISMSAAVEIAKLLLDKDPLNIEERTAEMDGFLVHNTTVKSAFDMALYDIIGKASGLPLYEVLGGGKRKFWTDITIGIGEPDYMAEKALQYKNQGFGTIKVKLGTTKEKDVERITKIREAVGEELPIRIDANQGWDFRTALNVLYELEPMGIEYCEQPVAYWNIDDMRRIRERTSIGIMADEALFDHHDAFRLASGGCCDYFNIKLAKSGGIYNALKINSIAEAAGIRCMVGCMTETRLGLTAAAHFVSAKLNIKYADLDGCFMLEEDPVIGGIAYKAGEIEIPDSAGIGAEVDPAFLKKCESVEIK